MMITLGLNRLARRNTALSIQFTYLRRKNAYLVTRRIRRKEKADLLNSWNMERKETLEVVDICWHLIFQSVDDFCAETPDMVDFLNQSIGQSHFIP